MQRTPSLLLLLLLAAAGALAAAALARSPSDRALFLALNALTPALPAALPSMLTILGHGLVAVMLLAPLLQQAPQLLLAALYAAPLGGIFSALGKRLAATPRPAAVLEPDSFHVQGQLLAGHNSFPSGHSITIFLVASVLILGLAPLRTRPLRAAAVLGLALVAASSRVLVGAHWPSDVLGGAALGMSAGVAGTWLAGRWPLWRRMHARRALALLVLGCALALALVDTGYPLARPAQYVLAALGALAALRTLLQPPAGSGSAAASS